MEQWRDIKGFEGYQVSSFGRVRTHNKISHTNKHGDRHWKDRILKFKKENYSFKNKSKVLETELICGKMENLILF